MIGSLVFKLNKVLQEELIKLSMIYKSDRHIWFAEGTMEFCKVIEDLRGNPPKVRVTCGQKFYTEFFCIANLRVTVFNIFLPSPPNKCSSSNEKLESNGEMKLIVKSFCLYVCAIFPMELFLNLFPRVPMWNCFRCYFRQLFISLVFIKCKNDSNKYTYT